MLLVSNTPLVYWVKDNYKKNRSLRYHIKNILIFVVSVRGLIVVTTKKGTKKNLKKTYRSMDQHYIWSGVGYTIKYGYIVGGNVIKPLLHIIKYLPTYDKSYSTWKEQRLYFCWMNCGQIHINILNTAIFFYQNYSDKCWTFMKYSHTFTVKPILEVPAIHCTHSCPLATL